MSSLQCDVSTPFNLCGVNTFFNPQTEFTACRERLVLIGQVTSGQALVSQPLQVINNEDDLFGAGSMLAEMVKAARCQARFAEIWALPLADFGTKGTAEITFSGASAATVGDVIYLVVNGQVYSVAFAPGDTDAMIAAAFEIAIDDPSLTVAASGDVLTISTLNGGDVGGALDVRSTYRVLNITDPLEVGVAINLTQGVGVPMLGAALEALNGDPYTFIANPYPDAVSMAALRVHLCKTWSPRERVRAESFTVMGGEVTGAQAIATTAQAPQIHLGYLPGMLDRSYEATAAFAMAGYQVLNTCNDPLTISNPVRGEVLTCLKAPELTDRLSINTLDGLIGDGISVFGVNAVGEVEIADFTTTYTQTDQGIEDDAFRDGNNVARLRYVAAFIEARVQATYGRHSIRSDDFSPRPGQRVVTTWELRAFVQGLGYPLSDRNIIEDPAEFARLVMVEWDGGSRCLNISVEPNLVNELCCMNLFINSRL